MSYTTGQSSSQVRIFSSSEYSSGTPRVIIQVEEMIHFSYPSTYIITRKIPVWISDLEIFFTLLDPISNCGVTYIMIHEKWKPMCRKRGMNARFWRFPNRDLHNCPENFHREKTCPFFHIILEVFQGNLQYLGLELHVCSENNLLGERQCTHTTIAFFQDVIRWKTAS